MITFKVDNRIITYSDPELNEKLAFALLKDSGADVGGVFDTAKNPKELHKQVDETWNKPDISLSTLALMHTYIDNLVPIDNFLDFLHNNNWFGGFDFDTGEFLNEVKIT